MKYPTARQKSHPASHPPAKPIRVFSPNWKETVPPKKPRIETIMAAMIPKESAVAKTITLNRLRSCGEGSFIRHFTGRWSFYQSHYLKQYQYQDALCASVPQFDLERKSFTLLRKLGIDCVVSVLSADRFATPRRYYRCRDHYCFGLRLENERGRFSRRTRCDLAGHFVRCFAAEGEGGGGGGFAIRVARDKLGKT